MIDIEVPKPYREGWTQIFNAGWRIKFAHQNGCVYLSNGEYLAVHDGICIGAFGNIDDAMLIVEECMK